ncbi:MAG TPA: DUF3592 domain-containing protein [Anaerolineales bacterium]|nr:DUF3592 domain-containing protein [Anaerolineales bacterium]
MSTSSSNFGSNVKQGFQTGCWLIFMNLLFIGLLAGGGYLSYNNYQLRTNGASTIGTVIRLEESSDSDGTSYSPVFRYEVNGQTYEFESQNSSNPPTHQVGDQDTIFYDPADPQHAQIDSFMDMWLAPGLLLCFGGGGFIAVNLGAIVWMVVRRK